jgi:hypothetical protein
VISNKTSAELIEIARNGGSLELDGAKYTNEDLVQIARSLTDQAKLTIHNANMKTATELVEIARNGHGKVTFA